MKTNLLVRLLVCGSLFLSFSCGTSRNLVYFSDLSEQAEFSQKINTTQEAVIQPDDILSISVSSPNPESDALFNRAMVTSPVNTPNSVEGYLVDMNGNINFPVLGTIQLGGLSKLQARTKLVEALQEYLQKPIVNIRFLNFKVTVIGEVSRPSTFTIPNDKINILEALGMAGDMTVYGKRENVLIVREKEGVRSMIRVDLSNKDFLSSPYFYLQQNDIVYVEPDKSREAQANPNNRFIPISVAAISAIAVLISTLLR